MTWAVAGTVLLLVTILAIGWWTHEPDDVRQVNRTLAAARAAVQHELDVYRERQAETDRFPCCGAPGPGGSFDGLATLKGGDAVRRTAERVAVALRGAGWHTWQDGPELDGPLERLDAGSFLYYAAPASALEAPSGPEAGQGIEVIVMLLDADDAELSGRRAGYVVVHVETWAQSLYAPT